MEILERNVIVGGCGHVGLPLGIVMAAIAGKRVTLLDIDQVKVEAVNRGEMPFREDGAERLLRQVAGRGLSATTDPKCLAEASNVITVVGTPVDEHLNPMVHAFYQSIDRTIDGMRDRALLVLRSTVYPGVTKLVYDRITRRGRKIHVAFCPERIAEGNALSELRELPQIVSAFDQEARDRAESLFAGIARAIIHLDPLEAELAKLFTNSWRYLNFAASNQFYMLATSYGLDFNRIHDAVTRDYPRMRSFARPGFAAGPCLLKDTLQLAAFAGNNFFMGHAAMLINEGLPNFIVSQLRETGLAGKVVAILGMAFKGESDDCRESLSYKLRKLLSIEASEVLCVDPYVKDDSLVTLQEALERADIIILGAPHKCYADLRLPESKTLLDVWGIWDRRTLTSREETHYTAGAYK
jgi:UDP-N-acetyl-D-mannosaminuronic acid dehydrogenase